MQLANLSFFAIVVKCGYGYVICNAEISYSTKRQQQHQQQKQQQQLQKTTQSTKINKKKQTKQVSRL